MQLETITQILQIDNFKVKSIISNTDNVFRFYLERINNIILPLCSGCGKAHLKKHSTQTVEVEDLPICGKRVFLVFEKIKLVCSEDGSIRVEELAWLRGNITKRFAECVSRLTAITTNQEAGWFLGLDDEKIYRIDKSILEEKAKELLDPLPEVKNLSVDEVAWQKWHKYVTNVVDVDQRLVIWNHKDRGKEVLLKFYKKLGIKKCAEIESVAMDGASGFITATQESVPQALLVFDNYHLKAKLNEAIDQVRKDELRKARADNNKELKDLVSCGERWLLLKNSNLSEGQQDRLSKLLGLNENIAKAKILKDDFLSIYKEEHDYEKKETMLNTWIETARTSGFEPFKELAETVQRKFQLIMNYFKKKISSAISEGINNKIKRLKRMAYGYRDIDYFLLKIHQHCGRLNPRLST